MKLIPALLQQLPGWASDDFRTLLLHGVKFGGMNIRNPVEGADRLFEASEAPRGPGSLPIEWHRASVSNPQGPGMCGECDGK